MNLRASSSLAGPPVLYAAEGADFARGLYRVNASTGAYTLLGDTHACMTGLAFHPVTGVLYGSTANTPVGDQTIPTGALVTIDTTTAVATLVGSFGLGNKTLADIAFDPATGILYGWKSSSSGDLYTVDLTTGQATLVGESGLSLSGGMGLSFGPSGKLYFAGSGVHGPLRTIDTTSGQQTSSVQLTGYPPTNPRIDALAFDGISLFGLTTTGELIQIDGASGAVTNIRFIKHDLDGLAFTYVHVVDVPTVTISGLTHDFSPANLSSPALPSFQSNHVISDAVTIPGPGYSSSGFTNRIATDDVVTVRFEAPAGKQFVVRHPHDLQSESFFFKVKWSAANDVATHLDPVILNFENLAGTPPAETSSLVAIGDGGHAIYCEKAFAVTGDFAFTAIQLVITASQPIAAAVQAFGPVESAVAPSWGVVAQTASGLDHTVMEIVDQTVGVPSTPGEGRPGSSLALLTANPTRGPLAAEFVLERETHVRLSLVDIQGREVALLKDGIYAPGRYDAAWDGRGRLGPAPAGVYFLHYEAGDRTFVQRVVITH